jgi:hypothetical protein
MIDAIKDFFQSMYDHTIGSFVNMLIEFYTWLGDAWDIILILIILVLAFFVFKVLKYITVPGIIISQMIMLTATISFMMAFVALLSTSIVAIYNRIFSLSDYIKTGFSSVDCLPYIFDCMGISGTFSYFFTELFALFITVLLIRISGLFFWAFNIISDSIWRIGVLLGLV